MDELDAYLFPFCGIGDVEYAVPLLVVDLETENPGPARFIDQDGSLYDKNYFLTSADAKDKENPFVPEAMALKGIPDPANYLSYPDYEQALLEWKSSAEEALGNVLLPTPLGRYLFRPRLGRSARSSFSLALSFSFWSLPIFTMSHSYAWIMMGKCIYFCLFSFLSENIVVRDDGGVFLSKDAKLTGESDSLSESDGGVRHGQVVGGSPQISVLAGNDSVAGSTSETVLTASLSDSGSKRNSLSVAAVEVIETVLQPVVDKELAFDPWETFLVPQEPDPRDFDTFQDFEAAFIRWASACSQKLAFLPPHANQLEDMIPIAIPQDNAQRTQEDENNVLPDPRKVGLVRVDFWEDFIHVDWREEMMAQRESTIRKSYQRGAILGQTLSKLPHELAKTFLAAYDKMYNNRVQNQTKYNMPNAPILPLIHGVAQVAEWIGNKHELDFRNDVLRRTDLSDAELAKCHDAPNVVGNKRIDFAIADYDLADLHYLRLLKDTAYNARQREHVLRLQFKYIYDKLSSWYYPKKSQTKSAAYRKDILGRFQQLIKSGGKLGMNEVVSVLESPLYLDEFRQDLLGDDTDSDAGGLLQYGNHLFNAFTVDTLPHVLQLFETHKERLIHAKVSSFIYNGLQNNRSKSMLDALIEKDDLRSLSLVAYAVGFFNEISVDLFPYREELVLTTLHAIGNEYKDIIRTIFTYYYLGCIHSVTALEPFQFVAVNSVITKTRETNAKKIVELLKAKPKFLQTLFKRIGHRSAQVSAVLLFVAVQLLHDTVSGEQGIKALLRSEMANLINEIKELSRSKLSHARFACRRLMTILKSDEWADVLLQRFAAQKDFIPQLLDPKQPKNSEFSQQLLDIAVMGLRRTHKLAGELTPVLTGAQQSQLQPVAFILSNTAFHTLLSTCESNTTAVDERIANVTRLLGTVTKTFNILKRIKFEPGTLSTATLTTDYTLILCEKDVTDICSLLRSASGQDERFVTVVQTQLLITLQNLLQEEHVWEGVKSSEEFHSTISLMCKKANFSVASEAWKLFYEMIAKHPGAGELMVKNKLIGNYLDLISVSSGMAVMHNAMRYLAKVLSLNKSSKKKDPDAKAVAAYIVSSHLFIKIHMIHRKLMDETPGAAFSEMVSFYVAIMSAPSCSKLLKEVSKTNDYRDGLSKVKALLGEDVAKEKEKDKDPKAPVRSTSSASVHDAASPNTKGDEIKKKSSFMDRFRSKDKEKDSPGKDKKK